MKKNPSICNVIPKMAFRNIFDIIAYAVLQEEALFSMVNGMLTPRKCHLNSEIQNKLKENLFPATICKNAFTTASKKLHQVPKLFWNKIFFSGRGS